MDTHTCIYSGERFSTASGEHILQNSMGARWVSDTIVCDRVQDLFGATIDVALADAFAEIRTLFAARGGRGGDAPTLKALPAASGETIDIQPGGQPRLNRPVVEVTPQPDGSHEVHIELGGEHQIEWALHELRQKLPGAQITAEMVRQHGIKKQSFVQGPVHLSFHYGSPEYFRAVVKASLNLIAASGGPALDPAFDAARAFALDGSGESKDFCRWPVLDTFNLLPTLGPVDQFLGFVTRGSVIEGVVRFFGGVHHAVRLTTTYSGPAVSFSYLVDPLREADPAEVRQPPFSEASVPVFKDQPEVVEDEAIVAIRARLAQVFRSFFDRAQSDLVSRIIEDTMLPHLGKPPTAELLSEVSMRVARAVCRVDE